MKKPSIRDSYIVRFFAYLTHLFYTLLPFGLLARIFTSYSATDRAFRNSGIGRAIDRAEHGGSRTKRAVRRNIALAMNKSRISNSASAFWRLICGCSLRTFGALFLTMGIYSAGMYWLFSAIWESDAVSSINLYWGAGFIVLGIVLLFSNHSLGYALSKSFFFGKLVVAALGVSDGGVRTVQKAGQRGYVIAVPLGMALGAVGALTSPINLLMGFVALLLVLMILAIPEAGVVLLIFAAPFVGVLPGDDLWLIPLILIPFLAYFGKLLRGNRVFHLEIQDVPVLLMLLLFLLSGFSFAGEGSWRGALLSALLVAAYFLVVNLIATPNWMGRCRMALILSAALSSVIAIAQFIYGAVTAVGDFDYLAVGNAVRAGFADRVSFAYFLLLALPFTLSALVAEKSRYRLLTGLALLLILTAAVMAFVPAALLAMLAALLAFFLLYYRRSLPFVLLGGGGAALIGYLMPDGAKGGAMTMLRADVTAAAPYHTTLQGLTGRILFGDGEGIFSRSAGILRLLFGFGYGGTERISVFFTSAPAQAVTASLNFWAYRLLEQGLLGVVLPVVFLFLLCQGCFSPLRHESVQGARQLALTGGMLVVCLTVFSLFHYTWYDPLALLMFFAVTAMVAADARVKRSSYVTPYEQGDVDEPGQSAELEYYGARS